jgi:hypothetical protein
MMLNVDVSCKDTEMIPLNVPSRTSLGLKNNRVCTQMSKHVGPSL